MADLVRSPLRLSRREALLLAGLTAMSPVLARSADTASSPIPGPRRRIGVRPLDVTPSFTSASTAGAAALIEAALITRLDATGCCKVVPRDEMAPLLAMLDPGKPPVSGGASAPADDVLPAQFIIAGSVRVNSLPDFGFHTFDGPPEPSRDIVEIDVVLSDTRTNMGLRLFQVESALSANEYSERGGAAGAPNTTDRLFASPLGKATDLALEDIVAQIAGALAALPWRGQVVRYDRGVVWVNAGGEDRVSVGDRFGVGRYGEAITDPDTGGLVNKVRLGVVTISNVETGIASGAYQPGVAGDPARGDWLVMLPR